MNRLTSKELKSRARALRLLLLDVDGVMTDGSIVLSGDEGETKRFHVSDGMGIIAARKAGIKVGFLTGRLSDTVRRRAEELSVDEVLGSSFGKEDILEELLEKYAIQPYQVAYVGDDIHDVPVLKRVGLPIAVSNARPEAKEHAVYVTRTPGGEGAVREAAEWLLDLRDQKDFVLGEFTMTKEEKAAGATRHLEKVAVCFDRLPERLVAEIPLGSLVITTDPGQFSERDPETIRPLSELLLAPDGPAALKMLKTLNELKDGAGDTYSQKVSFKGYEPWWFSQHGVMDSWLIPYTQYHLLLERVAAAGEVVMYDAPNEIRRLASLTDESGPTYRFKSTASSRGAGLGLWAKTTVAALFKQAVSVASLMLGMVRHPRVLVYAVDVVTPGMSYDRRIERVYTHLADSGTRYFEFIWSIHGKTALSNFIKRRRPGLYLQTVSQFAPLLTRRGIQVKESVRGLVSGAHRDTVFLHRLAAEVVIPASVRSAKVVKALVPVVRMLRPERAILFDDYRHSYELVVACKLSGVHTTGVQHGGFNTLSVGLMGYGVHAERSHAFDRYLVWSPFVLERLLNESTLYTEETAAVGGVPRPLDGPSEPPMAGALEGGGDDDRVRVLFILETYDPLTQQQQVEPYVRALAEDSRVTLTIKLRRGQHTLPFSIDQEILKCIQLETGPLEESFGVSGVVVGTWSTALLEATYWYKPVVVFATSTYDDPHRLAANGAASRAESPEQVVEQVLSASLIDTAELERRKHVVWGSEVPDVADAIMRQLVS